MPLAQKILIIKDFFVKLSTILETRHHLVKDRTIQVTCNSIRNNILVIRQCIEKKIFIENFLGLIDFRINIIYYYPELNQILIENKIEMPNAKESAQWYLDNYNNIEEYQEEIFSSIDECTSFIQQMEERLLEISKTP